MPCFKFFLCWLVYLPTVYSSIYIWIISAHPSRSHPCIFMVNPYCSTIFFKKGLLCENLLYTITYFRTLHGFIVLRGRGPQYGTLLEYPRMFTLPHLSIPVNQTIKTLYETTVWTAAVQEFAVLTSYCKLLQHWM